jgi:hypothetical protein
LAWIKRADLAGAALSQGPCTICGQVPRGPFELSLVGGVTCVTHDFDYRCIFCARGHGIDEPWIGWVMLARDAVSCSDCSKEAVVGEEGVQRYLPRVRADLEEIGIKLPRHVGVRFVEASALKPASAEIGGMTMGMTHMTTTQGDGGGIVIVLLRGLPPLMFGRVLAHEATHAWLAQLDAKPADLAIEEGLCEAVADAWLSLHKSPVGDRLRQAIDARRDPVYGDGFQIALAALRSYGLRELVRCLQRTGGLPTPGQG